MRVCACVCVLLHVCMHAFSLQELDTANFLPHIPNIDDVRREFRQVLVALEEYIRKTHSDWTATVDRVSPMSIRQAWELSSDPLISGFF